MAIKDGKERVSNSFQLALLLSFSILAFFWFRAFRSSGLRRTGTWNSDLRVYGRFPGDSGGVHETTGTGTVKTGELDSAAVAASL